MRTVLAALACAVLIGGLGCVHVHRPVHHGHKPPTAVLLADEHSDSRIVIVDLKPMKHRHCWKHKRHWHCRAR